MTKSTQTTDHPKYRVRKSLFVSLFIIWLMLNSTLAWQVWVLGAILAAVAAVSLRNFATAYAGVSFSVRSIMYYFVYLGLFLKELVKANLYVAHLVLMPNPDLRPAIIQVKISLKTAIGRLTLANSITLTPGTLVVDIKDDSLFIHCINISDAHPADEVRESVARFEKYLKVVYG